jgi:hypothetical protein
MLPMPVLTRRFLDLSDKNSMPVIRTMRTSDRLGSRWLVVKGGYQIQHGVRFFETNAVLSEHKTHAQAEAEARRLMGKCWNQGQPPSP